MVIFSRAFKGEIIEVYSSDLYSWKYLGEDHETFGHEEVLEAFK